MKPSPEILNIEPARIVREMLKITGVPGASPIPQSATLRGPLRSSSLTVKMALAGPTALGAYVTEIVQLAWGS